MSHRPSRAQIALVAAAAVVVAVLGARYLRAAPPAPAMRPGSVPVVSLQERRPTAVTVHVAGAVRRPGVYRLRAGARVDDAVRLAGGARPRADLGAVNLAAKVEDGRQVLVPARAAAGVPAAGAPGGAAGAAGTPGAVAPGVPVNLNSATLEQLDALPGVGPATAQKILDLRRRRGGFGSVDELREVPGIGDKRLAALREQVRV